VTSSTSEMYTAQRRQWLNHVANLILNSTTSRIFTNDLLAPVEQAMLTVHVGVGHLLGVADADSRVAHLLSPDQVQALISRYWRDGRLDPRIARLVPFLWASLYRLGRDTGTIRSALLEELFNSQLGRRIRPDTDHDLRPESVDTRVLNHIDQRQLKPSAEVGVLSLDCEGSHLRFIDALLEEGPAVALGLVTLLEIHACLPDDDEDKAELVALEAISNYHEIYRSMPGGWPGPGAEDVPDWVRDVAVNAGARMFYASTGHVPGWLVVAESEDELQALHHWTYGPVFGFGHDEAGNPVLSIQLTFPSDQKTASEWWYYPLEDERSVTHLRTLIAIGIVRLDVYKISPAARLEYVFSFGSPLPLPLREACREYLQANSLPASEVRLFHPPTPLDDLTSMTLAEKNLYDGLTRGMRELHLRPSSPLATAYRSHLETLDATTASAFGGIPGDDLHQASRESWRIALSQVGQLPSETIDLAPLGIGRGYAQFLVKLDEPVQLIARVAFLDKSGELATSMIEFNGTLNLGWDLEQQAAALAAGLSEFDQLLTQGVLKLVVCPAPAAYNLPLHEALMRLGFQEVSYTHRVATLATRERANNTDATIVGFAGEGPRHIAAVDTEIEIVSRLYGTKRNEHLPKPLPRIVHLAGHGHAGNRAYETAMEIAAAEPPLSSGRVLLDYDASKSDLVFLSACSSGSGSYLPDQLAEAIPMDVAFIEAGAGMVVSTSAPVNDHIACFFAAVFHSELMMAGTSVWEAFLKAREAAQTATLPSPSEDIEKIWPTWFMDVSAALSVHPHDWMSYRLSGRYWD
jgi:hypothetical protein